ncbi:MAG: SDR family oxidoreductase [Ectothiorhodospiraceae bacterium]|nr:SDR family oxidoreductase [Ectothiorhodospiraceae bacterium]
MARLADKVAVITGAASGIGRAAARLFAREGARVVVADVDGAGARAVADEIQAAGGSALAMAVDVASSEQVARMVADTVTAFGRLDVLVNNAGYGIPGTVVDTDEADWERLMAVNVRGVYLGCKHAIPVMRRQGGGVIVNTASAVSVVPIRERAAYAASKGAVAALTRAVAADHVSEGIRCNCVAPGTINTPYFDEMRARSEDPRAWDAALAARHAMNRLGTPEEIAYAMLYLACDESSFVTGTLIPVDGGMRPF